MSHTSSRRPCPLSRAFLSFLLVLLLAARAGAGVPADGSAPWQADNGDGTFSNPVIYADYPDPDIIRVGQDFYMVSTTFVNSPGINLLRSKDLVSWEMAAQVAPVVDGGDRFDMKNGATAYQAGMWACSLRYYKGTFYIAVQPTFAPGRIYYATNPAGPWSYHQLDRGIYDPGLFIDYDGKGYIVCGHSPQSLMVLSPDFSSIVDERKGFLPSGAEGCHVYRRGRYYYVFTAKPSVWPFELICWRTPDLVRPEWEKRVALTATTGGHQGGIIDLDDRGERWFGFVHQDSGSIGRMPRLGPVFWENNWPVFGTAAERDVMGPTYKKPITGQPAVRLAASDDFSGKRLGLQWAWNHNPDNARWSLADRPGWLRLRPSKADGFWTARNTLTQKTVGPKANAIVKLDISKLQPGDVAGFGVQCKISALAAVVVDDKGNKVLGTRVLKDRVGDFDFYPEKTIVGETLYLRADLDYEGNFGRTSYSLDGKEWTVIGGPFELVFGYGSTFQGPQYAIFCYNTKTDAGRGFLDVDSFVVRGGSPLATLVRGRARLNAARTTFVADNGQLLRGPYQSTEWTGASPYEDVANIKKLGFNTMHLYAESFDPKYPAAGSTAPGYAAAKIDEVVEHARKLGLYVVMTIGNGAHNGNHNKQWVVDFWKFYSKRYANESHVLFEVQNEPVAWGPPYHSPDAKPPGAIDMEVAAYKAIRENAPDTPVLLFSYAVFGEKEGAEKALEDIEQFNAGVGLPKEKIWNNAAVAFHGYAGHLPAPKAVARLIEGGYACFMTEFIGHSWGGPEGADIELTAALEELQVSWTNFLTVPPDGVSPLVTLPEAYKDRIRLTGVSWVPDFGEWPVARGVYGNDGKPRATTTTRVKNQFQGALRIELEDFDTGGPDVSYRDTSPRANEDGAYRPAEGVDIRKISDGGAGHAVTRTADDEWLEYTVFVKEPGQYRLSLRYAAGLPGSSVRILFYGREKVPVATLPATGGDNTWKTQTFSAFLEYGRQILRLEIPKGGCDLNWLEITPEPDGPLPDGEYSITNRGNGMRITNDTEAHKLTLQPPAGSKPAAAKPAAGAKSTATGVSAAAQSWKLEHLGAGQYLISSLEDKLYWSIDAGLKKKIGLVWWGAENPGPNQRVVIRPVGDGYYRIAPVALGIDFDIENDSAGALVTQLDYTAAPTQQWAIQKGGTTATPSGLAAVRVSEKEVRLNWNAVPGASGYHIKRADVSGGPYRSTPKPVRETVFLDWGAPAGKSYYYIVTAIGQNGESLPSAEVSPQAAP